MDPKISAPPLSSTAAAESCISSQAPPPSAPFQLLEISLISAQDLTPISKSMQTYAVAWINPTRKHTTRTDQKGHKNPTWNDKFVFSRDGEQILSENATVTVEIYTVSWFRDVLVGMVKVQISDLITPLIRARQNGTKTTRFVALQIRRPSGNPQGILNMGVALLDTTMRSMPLSIAPPGKNPHDIIQIRKNEKLQVDNDSNDDENREINAKIHLWRSLSAGSSEVTTNNEDFPVKPGSVYNGSTNGSELCSDIGPSASVVAAELAKKLQPPPPLPARKHGQAAEETGSSILEELTIEEAKAKGYRRVASRERWRKAAAMDDGDDDESELLWNNNGRRQSRRGSDGGLFSCFVYGIEFTIVCGASKNARGNKSSGGSRRKKNSETNSA
ncbi:hypothetical protein DH2020_028490 [Rehmannia glutinosa]|uniref:C2 domain-containing protein n=1 Tax=Rehmannia glutinosa TaxID=99300 RepID=A0ABR0VR76_REHGL